MDTIAANDGRKPQEQIQRIRELRPDMILLSGTDGGDEKKVTEIAERIAPARPQPRFGSKFVMPVIFTGNKDARGSVDDNTDDQIVCRPVATGLPEEVWISCSGAIRRVLGTWWSKSDWLVDG